MPDNDVTKTKYNEEREAWETRIACLYTFICWFAFLEERNHVIRMHVPFVCIFFHYFYIIIKYLGDVLGLTRNHLIMKGA